MTTSASEPLKLFYCYAHEDKTLRDELDAHLSLMKHQGLVTVWYDREIRLNPSFAYTYYNKGYALDELKRYEEAIVAYNQVIWLDPSNAVAYYNKSIALQHMNRNHEAQAAFEKAKQLGYPN